MYPDFQYLLQSLFGTEMPQWLSIFKTFGFLVALAFLGAAWALTKELRRKEQEGLLQPETKTVETGKPVSNQEIIISALLGFIGGFKAVGMLTNAAEVAPDPMAYLISMKGSLLGGIAGAALAAYVKYNDKKKQANEKPGTKQVTIWPHQRVAEIAIISAISGIIGAKIFNAFETWDQFIANPIESLISSSGLTFYGGLIVATASLYYYARKHNISFKHLCDAAAPALILAYGIGRLGCQFAGDGDWGIFNSAYVTQPDTKLVQVDKPVFENVVHNNAHYFINNFKSVNEVPNIYAPAPSWLPNWMFAMNYPHNVNNEGVPIEGCTGYYCSVLPVGVFPTPLYEAVAGVLLFLFLWSLRRRLKRPLQMFGAYLIVNGLERFLVEKIRVNYKYDWGFIHPTQAEIISFVLILCGAGLLLFYKGKTKAASE